MLVSVSVAIVVEWVLLWHYYAIDKISLFSAYMDIINTFMCSEKLKSGVLVNERQAPVST